MDKRTGLRKSQKRARRDLRRITRRKWVGGWLDLGDGRRIRVVGPASFREALDSAIADWWADFMEPEIHQSGLEAAAEQELFDWLASVLWDPTQVAPESR